MNGTLFLLVWTDPAGEKFSKSWMWTDVSMKVTWSNSWWKWNNLGLIGVKIGVKLLKIIVLVYLGRALERLTKKG